MANFDKRAVKLEKKLGLLVSRIGDGSCPVHVCEIWIFGSAVRLKEDPHDIDLVLFYKKDVELDSKVGTFRDYISQQRGSPEGRKTLQAMIDNREFARKAGSEIFHLPIERWTSYLHQTGFWAWMGYSFNEGEVTKRILKKGMHGLQISELNSIENRENWRERITATTFRQIWSEEKPDLEANLKELLSSEGRTTATLSELPNFLEQAERFGAYYDVLRGVTAWTVKWVSERTNLPDNESLNRKSEELLAERGVLKDYWEWIKSGSVGGFSNEPKIHTRITNRDLDADYSKISGSDSKTLNSTTEELRAQVRRLIAKGQVVRLLLHEILSPARDYWISPISQRLEAAAKRTLSWIPMYTATDDLKREVLKEVGLETVSQRIILLESAHYKPEYRLAESEEEVRELTRRQAEGRIERTHIKYIRPVVRKVFPPPSEVYFSLETNSDSKGPPIPSRLKITISVQKNATDLVETAKRIGFEHWEESHWEQTIDASLDLDLSAFDGDTTKIKHFIRDKMSLK